MAYIVMVYIAMAHVVMACMVMAYIIMAHVVMVCTVMAYIVMAWLCAVTTSLWSVFAAGSPVDMWMEVSMNMCIDKQRNKRMGM